jgi:hypothetical protein
MSKAIENAKSDIASVVPHLRQAATDAIGRAKPGAIVKFAIVAQNPDGTGQVGATFDCEAFLSDLEMVFPPSEDAKLEAAAACLVSKLGPPE